MFKVGYKKINLHQNVYINLIFKRTIHGYSSKRLKFGPFRGPDLRSLRCGLVFGIFIGFRLEMLSRFRRLRKSDMYRRRTVETRENIFILGTLINWSSSERDRETNVSLMYMDKWCNKCHFNFRTSAFNVFGLAQWDLRSFFRSYPFYLGRKNHATAFLSDAIRANPGKWQLS